MGKKKKKEKKGRRRRRRRAPQALRGNGSVPDLDGKRRSEMGLLSSPDSQQEMGS